MAPQENAKSFPFRIKKLIILPKIVIYIVHDFIIGLHCRFCNKKKEHLGSLPDLAISKRQRRWVEKWP
jgi:hypothetical protein